MSTTYGLASTIEKGPDMREHMGPLIWQVLVVRFYGVWTCMPHKAAMSPTGHVGSACLAGLDPWYGEF